MKRSGGGMWLTVVTVGAILLAHLAPAAAQDASIIRATRVDGTVTRNDRPLKEGDIVARDDRVVAAPNSAAVLTWSNGSLVELYPETALVVRGVVYEGEKKLEKTLLTLERGRLFAKAQVAEHLFNHFELSVGDASIMSQGAELAIRYEEGEKRSTVWSLVGIVIAEMGAHKVRIAEGQQAILKTGARPDPPAPMPERTRDALTRTSQRLGGSLLIAEEAGPPGGPLQVRIGGITNRRGNAPYTVTLRAVVRGGSGRIKSINWSLGDGTSASGREVQHTFTQGVYVVVVRVEDDGQKASAQLNISVEEECGC